MRTSPNWILSLLCAAAASAAWADDDGDDARSQAAALRPFGAGANDAPRFTRSELPVDGPRSLPGYRHELNEFSQRWWVSKGRADVGLGLGTLAYATRPFASPSAAAVESGASVVAAAPVLTLGMRYRTSERSALYADASGVGRLGVDGSDRVVGKLGVEFKSAQSRWNIGYGGLGLSLAGDTRMTLRLRRGGLALSMHSAF